MPAYPRKRLSWGAVAVVLLAISALGARAAAQKAEYVRLQTSRDVSLIVQIQGNELRVAATEDGLKSATPITAAAKRSVATFEGIEIPLTPEARMAGCTGVTAKLSLFNSPSVALVATTATYKDAKGVTWIYESLGDAPLADAASAAAAVQVAMAGQGSLEIASEPAKDKGALGVGLRAKMGSAAVTYIWQDGAAAEARVQLFDSTGKEATSKTGPLNSFGFG